MEDAMGIAGYAAIGLIWAYVIAFLLLTAMTSQRNGRSVWLFGKGSERQGLPAFLFRVAFILGASYPPLSIWLGGTSEANASESTDPVVLTVSLPGLAMMLVGATFALYAQHHMGASWRIGAASGQLGDIVNTGPFAISRNPVFVGQVLLFAGVLLVFPTIVQLVIAITLIVAVRLQVRIEERVLACQLGDAYRAYQGQVRRWL
jgi:protein-S-isoprenylcysteine O-methyltransferase Ste14